MLTIEEEISVLKFAKGHNLFAGFVESRTSMNPPTKKMEVRVWNIKTGAVVHCNQLDRPEWEYNFDYIRELESVVGDQWLVGLDMFNAYDGGPVPSARLNLRFCWNLSTNRLIFTPDVFMLFVILTFDFFAEREESAKEKNPNAARLASTELFHDFHVLNRLRNLHISNVRVS